MNTKMIKRTIARIVLSLFGFVVLYGIYKMIIDVGGQKYLLEGLLFTSGLVATAFLFSRALESA